MRKKWTRAAKRGTLLSNETWEGDRRRTTLQLSSPGEKPVTPDLVLWADSDHGVVLSQQVVLPDAPPEVVAEVLQRAMDSPAPGAGPPRQPRRIRVNRQEIAEAIRPIAESLGIRVEVTESLPLADDVYRDFEVHFGTPAAQGYLDASDVSAEALEELFESAAAFYRARPWRAFDDTEPFLLECADWVPPYRFAVVLGASGHARGIAVYKSLEHLDWSGRPAQDASRLEEDVLALPVVALLFTDCRDLGERRLEEVSRGGWQLASRKAYPLVLCGGGSRESLWPTPGEVRMLVAVLRALLAFKTVHARAQKTGAGSETPAHIFTVPVGQTNVEVAVTFPLSLY